MSHRHTEAGPNLVGRSAELAVLAAAFAAARGGSAQLIIVRGPSGIGKTALLGRIGGEGTILRTVGDRAAYSTVRALLGLDPGHPLPDDEYEASQELYRLALDLLGEAPFVLVVDNADRCDDKSLRWLEFLLRRGADLPLMIVLAECADGPVPYDRRLAAVTAAGRAHVIEPAPLGQADIADVIRRELRRSPAAGFTVACAKATEGNPRSLLRLLAEVREQGVRSDEAGAPRVAELGSGLVRAAVRERLARWPESLRRVARAAAVLQAFDPELVSSLSVMPIPAVIAAFDVLKGYSVPGAGDESRQLDVLSAVLDELTPVEHAALRRRAARILNDAGEPIERVAEQLLALDTLDEPWMRGVLACAAGVGWSGALPFALRCLARLVETAPEDVDARVDLAAALVEVDPWRAAALLEEALPWVRGPHRRAVVAELLGAISLTVPGVRPPAVVLSEALAALGTGGDGAETADEFEVRVRLEALMRLRGSGSLAVLRERPRDLPGDTPAERQALVAQALLVTMRGTSAAVAADFARRALSGPQPTTGWTAAAAAAVLFLADEFDEAIAGIGKAIISGGRRNAPWTELLALSTKAWILAGAGEITEAALDITDAVEIADRAPWGPKTTLHLSTYALVLFNQGDVDRAEAVLDKVEKTRRDGVSPDEHYFLLGKSAVAWFRQDLDSALAHALRCGELLDDAGISNPVFAPWWLHAATLMARMGRAGEAVGLVERGEEMARRWGTARASGLVLMAKGTITRGPGALDVLTEATELLAGTAAKSDHARAEALLGMALLRAQDLVAAREHLRRAVDLSVQHGGWASATTARDLLLAAGGRMPQVTGDRVDLLTGREQKVARIAARGASNSEIADVLSVTLRTVEVHLTSVYRKLGVLNRADLAPLFEADKVQAEGR
ncbi:helix-turn-helix transcriptional regulator [Amycolatopsis sp. H20-H5]|uniref:helix-turn-helix transcriptional regulator n=1 Tax=Amycolatopsis sp. H20-H5 TaxID=3046309 RepID=UPI002DBE87A5|nr:LuxR C-terminal-related transcriptional regulator [Amycolatopsis sp. H20-H5]MEC3981284.1 LuxR C-terminal-related transcriptional regulator [Amycolatopsis sp. H20-H5]